MTHTLADGCCSAVKPCSWQQKNPTTICDTCRAASPSVSAWLAEQEKDARLKMEMSHKDSSQYDWHYARAMAFEHAYAYAAARPDRSVAPSPSASITDADLAYLAGLAISSRDTTLARIAAALLLAR